MSCKICETVLGRELTGKVLDADITISEAARKLGVPYKVFEEHLKEHMDRALPRPIVTEKAEDIDLGKTLREVLLMLKSRAQVFVETDVTPENERMLSMLVKELRGISMNIAELEGKLMNMPLVELKSIKMQFNDLTGFMITDMCPVCKAKIQQKLDDMINVAINA